MLVSLLESDKVDDHELTPPYFRPSDQRSSGVHPGMKAAVYSSTRLLFQEEMK